ncbi:glycosyltransferase family 39 protein [Candidatus Dependentiae bacterium]|nr:glycosyltransferase family 39 protein [Candidatus Dependentiae bacterium]MCG2756424.1 glycosyltransferase family 39 protein [Candidatus Dependentiae bacterium]
MRIKIFWAIFLFLITFVFYFFSVENIWFSLDDCGNVIAGIIKSKKDLIRIFLEDERNYLYPINFNVPQANFISGFYRPMQHIPFSIIYYLFEFNVKAYYFLNVFFHALNISLFFYLTSFFMPNIFAVFAGLLLAFYPIMDWITWISTLHNFLATFFMLLSLICFRFYWIKNKFRYNFLAALFFLFSICSRENTIFLGILLFIFSFIFSEYKNLRLKFKFAFNKTYLFLFIYIIYLVLRIMAFGFESLPRTFNNICMRFPAIKELVS